MWEVLLRQLSVVILVDEMPIIQKQAWVVFQLISVVLVTPTITACSWYDSATNEDAGVPVCNTPCPEGSECIDLDGICEPECVWPTGKLACSDDSHCPNEGSCRQDGTCGYEFCGCTTDDVCPSGFICLNEDGACGVCMPRELYECDEDADCVAAVLISKCCAIPMPRNITTVQNEPCLVEYPYEDAPPEGCEPGCSCDGYNHHKHCWPLPSEPLVVSCRGLCRMEPLPGP